MMSPLGHDQHQQGFPRFATNTSQQGDLEGGGSASAGSGGASHSSGEVGAHHQEGMPVAIGGPPPSRPPAVNVDSSGDSQGPRMPPTGVTGSWPQAPLPGLPAMDTGAQVMYSRPQSVRYSAPYDAAFMPPRVTSLESSYYPRGSFATPPAYVRPPPAYVYDSSMPAPSGPPSIDGYGAASSAGRSAGSGGGSLSCGAVSPDGSGPGPVPGPGTGPGPGPILGSGPSSGQPFMPQMVNYSFVPAPNNQQNKRPRRRYEEIERIYDCNFPGCTKAYGTLNHLNAHVAMQNHGKKRTPDEFKETRRLWKLKKKQQMKEQAVKQEQHGASGSYTHHHHHHHHHQQQRQQHIGSMAHSQANPHSQPHHVPHQHQHHSHQSIPGSSMDGSNVAGIPGTEGQYYSETVYPVGYSAQTEQPFDPSSSSYFTKGQ